MDDKDLRNGWNEWSRHVLAELKRLNDVCESLRDEQESADRDTRQKLFEIHGQIASLKTQTLMYSSIAAIIMTAIIEFALKR